MHSAVNNSQMNTSQVGPNFRSTKLAAVVRGAVTLAVLSALLMFAVYPAQAQTENVLYNFTGTPDGANPYSSLIFNAGNLFGTTSAGGLYGSGTVFELAPNGTGGWTETVLYNFCPAAPSCADGQTPAFGHVVFDTHGNLYGTTYAGGAHGDGAVFELSPSGSTWTETVLYSFAGKPDAANPINGLILDVAGNLYGTAFNGGGGNNGAVFELSPATGGGWTEQVIANVAELFAGLAMDSSGNLYGTTATTVFKLTPNGANWFPSTIFTFATSLQGTTPNGTPVLDSAGNVYGTTTAGGKNNLGVIYKLVKGTTAYTEKVIYNFGANGTKPNGGVVLDAAGNLYGTTTAGGRNGAGIVYELVYNNGFYVAERSLQAFIGINGAIPYDSLILDSGGYLYGTSFYGGSSGMGTVFVVNPHASTTTITVASSLNPSKSGQAVTFTATVSSAGGTPPDGDIVVFEPIGQSPMKGGVATYTTSALKVGTTNITAVFNGDLNFIGSKSTPLPQVVTQ
jgi:uncharacterized repeat protein (TIGR03803 family)